mgnify:CR=1 FL=1
MAQSNLEAIVREGVPENEVHLIPVIEKELIHYDVLFALEKLGLLERLVFHGGTCLRLCYGAQLMSHVLGGKVEKIADYRVPGTEVFHRAVVIRKVRPTPKQYPRRFARIKQSPL